MKIIAGNNVKLWMLALSFDDGLLPEHVNSRAKTAWGAKPCNLSGKVAPWVAEVRSLFPRVRGSMSTQKKGDCSERWVWSKIASLQARVTFGRSCAQNAHQTQELDFK